MTTLPVLPNEWEDPWFEKQRAFDSAVKTALEGYLSPEALDFTMSQMLPKTLFVNQGDLAVGIGGEDGGVGALPRGLAGQVLVTDPIEPLGLKWSSGLTEAQETAQQAINDATQALQEGIVSVITEYAIGISETVAPTTGWSTDQPARLPGELIWVRTTSTKGDGSSSTSSPALLTGNAGPQGIPGEPGADGSSRYTWIKYADTPTTGMSESPVGKAYMGIAYNKTSSSESSVYADYEWSLIQGPQGIPGDPGADGTPRYTWIKYADTPTTGISDDPTGKVYLGIAYNKTTATETSNYADYEWSLIQGPEGEQGIPGVPGADGTPRYTWIKYADTPTTGMSDSPAGKIYMGIAYNKTTAVESSTYSDYEWSLVQGPQGIPGTPGADGTPRYTWIKYGTSAAGAGLSDDPVGKTYMGIAYNKTTAVESTTPGDYEWSLIQGAAGIPGADGIGLTSAVITYQLHTNGTTAPTGTWVSSPPATSPGQFLWTRTVLTWTNATTTTAYSVAAHGATGSTGSNGTPATNIVVGNDAVAIPVSSAGATLASSSIVIPFGGWLGNTRVAATVVASGLPSGITAGTNTPATVSADGSLTLNVANASTLGGANNGEITLTFTVNGLTFVRKFSWAKAISGAAGGTGSTGTSATSVDVGNEAAVIPCTAAGAVSAAMNITIPFTGYIGGTRAAATVVVSGLPTGITVSTNTPGTSGAAGSLVLAVANGSTLGGANTGNITLTITVNGISFVRLFTWTKGITGATGSTGGTGVGVSSVTPYFLQVAAGSSTPAKPTLNPPGGSWSLTEPAYTTSTELYRTELVVYTNATFAYTNVTKVSSYTGSNLAYEAANLADDNAKGMIKFSQTDPGHLLGRIWFVLDGSGNTIGIKTSNGSAWASYTLMADSIMVPSSYGPVFLGNGSVIATSLNGQVVTGATIQTVATALRGVKMDSGGFYVYNNSGVKTVDINGTTGAVTLTGTINAAAGTFSGNIALTGTIQASGSTASTTGFYALDTTVNMGTKLVPRGLEFYDNGAIQSVAVKTRKISTGDPLTPGVIALYFEDPIASIALEISQYKFGTYPYSVRVAKPIMFESGVIFASNGALVRRGTSTASEVAFAWVGNGLASNLPTGTNVDTGSLGLVQTSGATSGGDDGGLYRYTGSAWKPIALSVMPAMYHNGIDGSAPSISANTWTLLGNVALGAPRFVQGFQSYPSGALTIAKRGIYLISYSIILLAAPTSFNTRVTKNSTSPGTDSVSLVSRNDANTVNTVASAIVELDVGDVLRLYAYSTSSSTIRALPQTNYSVVMIAPL